MMPNYRKDRLIATAIHFGISLAIAGLAALLVFFVWYPAPYWEVSGGRNLFLLVVSVDVIMGPLLTLVVFNRNKPNRELLRDLSVIGLLQVAALAYGLWTVAVARPVHLVFEIDRFRVVHAIDIPVELLGKAPEELRQLPLGGPTLLSVRPFKNSKESYEATMAAIQGIPLSARPDLWQSYTNAKTEILARAKPLSELKARFPAHVGEIDQAIQSSTTSATNKVFREVGYVPMVGRNTFWTVLLDLDTTEIISLIKIDSF